MAPSAGDFPYLRATLRLGGKDSNVTTTLFDVQFYPYTPAGVDPVFAVTGRKHTFVCRPVLEKDNAVEILREFKDDDKDVSLNSLVWSQDVETGDPLLCVAGEKPAIIKILNIRTGKLARSLTGHGDGINDLAVSPISPAILASASADHSIRIWNLEPEYEKQPCSVILSGKEGHREGVLAIGFHQSGRYLISGSIDTSVKLWVVPELPNNNTGSDRVNIIHYPHFSTTEIHTDYVDCVRFYGDLILSKSAKENRILLWKIDGFNSSSPPPPISTSAQNNPYSTTDTAEDSTAYGSTYSAFGTRFQRLLTFDSPHNTLFYMRFGIFHMPNKHPILVTGNEKSKIFWWDLQRLEEGSSSDHGKDEIAGNSNSSSGGGGGVFRMPNKRKRSELSGPGLGLGRGSIHREESIASNASSGVLSTATGASSSAQSNNSGDKSKRYDISSAFHPIPAHKHHVVPRVTFAVRQTAFSVGGEWAVAVGDNGMVALFRRWD